MVIRLNADQKPNAAAKQLGRTSGFQAKEGAGSASILRSLHLRLNTYLNFDGQCEAAFKFYERTLGGKIEMLMTYGDSPMCDRVAPELRNRVMHVTLSLGDGVLMGSDAPSPQDEKAQGFFLHMEPSNLAEAEGVFGALSEDGTVHMPFQKTFWSPGFGMVMDKFGTPWMINCRSQSDEGSR
jgi:PhnB protein